MPALLVLVLAAGLRRGRRFAWWAAMVFHVLLLALGTFYAIDYYNWAVENDALDQGFSWVAWLLPLVLLPVLIIVLLMLTRRSFTVQAPVGIYRKLGLSVLGVVLALWALYVIVGSLIADQFTPTATVGELIVDFPIRLLPNGYLYIIEPAFEPTDGCRPVHRRLDPGAGLGGHPARVCCAASSPPGSNPNAEDRAWARAMLERNGTTALAYLTTWDGQQLLVLRRRTLVRRLPGGGRGGDHHRRSGRAAGGPGRDRRGVRRVLQRGELDAVPVQHDRGGARR